MKLDHLNKWLMLLANIGVIIGIVFLAIEVNQNTTVTQSSARQESLNAELWLLEQAMAHPEVATTNAGAQTFAFPDLSSEESLNVAIWHAALFRVRENLWFQYRNGVLDEQTWNSSRQVLISQLKNNPSKRQTWEFSSESFSPGFVSEINDELYK